MMKNRLNLLILVICPFLVQCATRSDMQTMDLRVRNLDNRLVKLDKNMEEGRTADQATLERLQKQLAQQHLAIERLKNELLQAMGQLDETSRSYSMIQEESETLKKQLSGSVGELAGKMADIKAKLGETSSTLEEIRAARLREETERVMREAKAAELAAAKAKALAEQQAAGGRRQIEPDQVKKKVGGETPVVAPTESGAPVSKVDGAEDPLGRATSLFNARKYQEAHRAFSDYLEKNPKGSSAAEARFFLGECLLNREEFELAILEYQRVIDEFAGNPMAAAALLQQGMAFEKLEDTGTAKMVYYKLLDEYSKSEQAAKAKKRLDALN